MNTKKFSEAINEVNDKYYEEAASYQGRRKQRWVKRAAVAACFCLVAVGAVIILSPHTPDGAVIFPPSHTLDGAVTLLPPRTPVGVVENMPVEIADAPLMVYVNDTLYRDSLDQTSYSEMKEDFVYLGEVESDITNEQSISDGVPKKNFQANYPIVGSKIYQYGNNIVILINGQYWLYEPVE